MDRPELIHLCDICAHSCVKGLLVGKVRYCDYYIPKGNLLQTPFKFKDEKDRLRSVKEQNEAMSWLSDHVGQISLLTTRVERREELTTSDAELLEIVLKSVVYNIYHAKAESDFFNLGESECQES